MKTVAVYGSLREGFHNHHMMGNAKHLGNDWIDGSMYLVGKSYPRLFKIPMFWDQDNSSHMIEVYEISDDAHERIKWMEEGAGYFEEEIETKYGPAIIYWSEPSAWHTGLTYIEAYTKEALQ